MCMARKYPPAKPAALRLLAPQSAGWYPVKTKTANHSLFNLSQRILLSLFLRKQESSFSGFRVAFHLPGMTIIHSRNCKTLGVPPQRQRFT